MMMRSSAGRRLLLLVAVAIVAGVNSTPRKPAAHLRPSRSSAMEASMPAASNILKCTLSFILSFTLLVRQGGGSQTWP
jgi:hypothetical protein